MLLLERPPLKSTTKQVENETDEVEEQDVMRCDDETERCRTNSVLSGQNDASTYLDVDSAQVYKADDDSDGVKQSMDEPTDKHTGGMNCRISYVCVCVRCRC